MLVKKHKETPSVATLVLGKSAISRGTGWCAVSDCMHLFDGIKNVLLVDLLTRGYAMETKIKMALFMSKKPH